MFGYRRMITDFKINLKRTKFTYWKDRKPTYYEIRFWAWLYNLANMITDYFSLSDDRVRLRIDIRKDLIKMATSEPNKSKTFFKTGTLEANQMSQQEKDDFIQQLKNASNNFKIAE